MRSSNAVDSTFRETENLMYSVSYFVKVCYGITVYEM